MRLDIMQGEALTSFHFIDENNNVVSTIHCDNFEYKETIDSKGYINMYWNLCPIGIIHTENFKIISLNGKIIKGRF